MKIHNAVYAEIQEWILVFKDDGNNLINYIAIPPTSGDRIDVFLETRLYDIGVTIKHQYLYNFLGNIKKLKGEIIIIEIKNGIVCIKK
jgi:hypothetical protein